MSAQIWTMKRFLLPTLGVFVLAIGLVSPAFGAQRPNVLFISVDDMNNDLGTYGHPLVKSPSIDKLAAEGVRFDRAYCQFPFCSPSRSSVMTGLRPDETRVFDLRYHFRQGLPDVVTLPQLFMKHGYFAARVGKIYHYGNPGEIGTSGLDDPASWDKVVNPSGRDKTLESRVINYTPKRGLGSSLSMYADPEGKDEDYTDGKVATEAIRLMEENKDRPFFLAVGFYKPHCPYIVPAKYFDLYPLDEIKLPVVPANYSDTVPAAALASTQPWPLLGVTTAQARETVRAYYATLSFVDAQVGRVMEALDRLKLRENTIVVFWSDHGYHLGDHGLFMKQSLYENSARVPLIIIPPKPRHPGKASPRTVELLDMYPTLADLAGIAVPPAVEGRSLRPLLENPEARWDHPAFTQVQRGGFPGYSARTERWSYMEWDRGAAGRELYDLAADPGEMNNLAGNPAYAATLAEMQKLVKAKHAHPVEGGKAPGTGGKGKKR